MSRLEKSIRLKRYSTKSNKPVLLHFSLPTGEQYVMKVVDCSSNGLRGEIENAVVTEEQVQIGSIIPNSKISWEKSEAFLGRLVLQRISKNNDKTCLAFSTIDSKIPVQGSLSHCLEIDFTYEDLNSPQELSSNKFSLAHFAENDYANVDLFNRIRQFSIFQREWEKSDKYAYKNVRVNSKGTRIDLAKVRPNGRKDYIVMGSNDYLGLGAHPEVVAAAENALKTYGFGSTGSPLTTGNTALHIELEEKIAHLFNKEAALLFNSGYVANVGIINSVTAENDLIVADQLCHASIQDGMQMSKATSRFFKHNDAKHLESILEKERDNFNGCLIITEGIFSMDGDVAKLDEIYEVARRYNARLMVDEAHDFGVLGSNGLGVCEKFHLIRETDIIMGTFSKICGSIGGFVVGSKELIEWIRSTGRSHIFSVALPPSNCAATIKALEIFSSDKSLRQKLKENINHFINGLKSLGYQPKENHESSVIPVVIGNEEKLGEMYQSLLADGVLCIPVVYPAVGRKNCRFRFTIMANHTVAELDYAVSCLEKAMIKSEFTFNKDYDKAA